VTSVTGPEKSRTTPNEKWVFFDDKFVTAEGVGSIGTSEYVVSIEATLWGKLSPDGSDGAEWGVVTLRLSNSEEVLECHGSLFVKRYPDSGPIGYGESGGFRSDCDDGSKVKGDVVGEFGDLDGVPGFLLTMDGMAR
ncbi:MAG: hypothetical protein ACR2NL_00990, partial [Acidimicrobiia bacterium]